MRIGIVSAMAPEMDLLLDNLENAEEIKVANSSYYVGEINGKDVVISQCGIGKVNSAISALTLIKDFECSLIINTGIAGGTLPLATKDVIIASELVYHDFDATIFGYQYGQVPQMPVAYYPAMEMVVKVKSILNRLDIPYKVARVYSGDQFVTSMDAFKNFEIKDGVACEMEGTSVAQVCTRFGVDFLVLRYISDVIGSKNQEYDYLEFEAEMAERSARICLTILNNL